MQKSQRVSPENDHWENLQSQEKTDLGNDRFYPMDYVIERCAELQISMRYHDQLNQRLQWQCLCNETCPSRFNCQPQGRLQSFIETEMDQLRAVGLLMHCQLRQQTLKSKVARASILFRVKSSPVAGLCMVWAAISSRIPS